LSHWITLRRLHRTIADARRAKSGAHVARNFARSGRVRDDRATMSAKRMDRMPLPDAPPGSCVVCGVTDARALCLAALEGGRSALVCGTHDLVYRRAGRPARSIEDLRDLTRDRRRLADRRGTHLATPGADELALRLAHAFVRERRSGVARRA
jgi:hypothetical protein